MGGQEYFLNLWRGEGTDYIAPAVAGSSPVSGASRCSSIGRAMANIRAVDSRHKRFRRGEGARYFCQRAVRRTPERVRLRNPLALRRPIFGSVALKQKLKPTHASRSFPPEQDAGMAQCRVTSHKARG